MALSTSKTTSALSIKDIDVKDVKKASNNHNVSDNKSLSFLWLEITRKCNLHCVHCYADSAPNLAHGLMTSARWKEIITEASQLGVRSIQFIGGEPTLHPDFVDLVGHATQLNFSIEIFSNLTYITPSLWELFQESNASIATSFYSLHPSVHNKITHHNKSQTNTLNNIKEALRRDLNVRVGIIEVFPEQDISATESMLRDLGVKRMGKDRTRGIGRGLEQTNGSDYSVDELCGSCGLQNAAIDPDGNVYPCVFSRWLSVGNVQDFSLGEVIFGEKMANTKAELNKKFTARWNRQSKGGQDNQFYISDACSPDERCRPDKSCNPIQPCRPDDKNCRPSEPDCRPIECNPRCEPSDKCSPNDFND